ncbi:MAG: Cu(I)-responsive transcriptional regulator [Alphaproteobacteria bacterium]|nr:Cu(I)-responsive transcriptional regulator [Alphaproteobacteria bacterium]
MNIGDAAKATGLSAKTIRYYEGINLVVADRSGNGYRNYSDAHIHKLRFVRRARRLGFSIDVCRALLSLYQDRNRASSEVKSIAKKHLGEIEAKIVELQNLQETLSHLIDHCAGDDRPDCPIMDGLSGDFNETAADDRKLH